MSFRNTFITDFIYAGSDETKVAMPAVTQVFKEHTRLLSSEVDDRGMGFYAGFIGTSNLDVNLSELELEPFVNALEKATPVPFRLTVMQESGAVITYSIQPRGT